MLFVDGRISKGLTATEWKQFINKHQLEWFTLKYQSLKTNSPSAGYLHCDRLRHNRIPYIFHI